MGLQLIIRVLLMVLLKVWSHLIIQVVIPKIMLWRKPIFNLKYQLIRVPMRKIKKIRTAILTIVIVVWVKLVVLTKLCKLSTTSIWKADPEVVLLTATKVKMTKTLETWSVSPCSIRRYFKGKRNGSKLLLLRARKRKPKLWPLWICRCWVISQSQWAPISSWQIKSLSK